MKINDNSFDFYNFLDDLNNSIPYKLSSVEKIKKLREIWPYVKKNIPNVLDQSDKIILYGIMHLPINKEPKEKTLRKLSLFVNQAEQIHFS